MGGCGFTALYVSRSFSSDDQQVEIPLGVTVQGNVLIIVHHIRSLPIGKAAGVVGIKFSVTVSEIEVVT